CDDRSSGQGSAVKKHGSRRKMLWQVVLSCVRVAVLVAIIGGIGYVVYDNVRSDQGSPKNSAKPAPPVPKAGDVVTINGNAVACPAPEDMLKVRDLLRTNSDRQPAASYAVQHNCIVLSKSRDYKIEAYSARNNAGCLQVPSQRQCYWTPVDVLTTK